MGGLQTAACQLPDRMSITIVTWLTTGVMDIGLLQLVGVVWNAGLFGWLWLLHATRLPAEQRLTAVECSLLRPWAVSCVLPSPARICGSQAYLLLLPLSCCLERWTDATHLSCCISGFLRQRTGVSSSFTDVSASSGAWCIACWHRNCR